jgi:hypothetical protein
MTDIHGTRVNASEQDNSNTAFSRNAGNGTLAFPRSHANLALGAIGQTELITRNHTQRSLFMLEEVEGREYSARGPVAEGLPLDGDVVLRLHLLGAAVVIGLEAHEGTHDVLVVDRVFETNADGLEGVLSDDVVLKIF